MRYAMTFSVDVYDFDKDEGERVIARPGDYIRMRDWADEAMPGEADDLVRNLRVNYALAWFALRRLGRLDDYGLPGELSVAALDAMADRLSVFVEEYEGSAPLSEKGPTS